VVEHDKDMILGKVDYVIDMGPQLESNGSQVVAQGTAAEVLKSLTP
jgi:excinuclease UvrABC ATPase subunit